MCEGACVQVSDWIFLHQAMEAQQQETALDHFWKNGTPAEAQLLQDRSSTHNPRICLLKPAVFCFSFYKSVLDLLISFDLGFCTELLYWVWSSVRRPTLLAFFFFLCVSMRVCVNLSGLSMLLWIGARLRRLFKAVESIEPPRSSVHHVEEEGEGFCD